MQIMLKCSKNRTKTCWAHTQPTKKIQNQTLSGLKDMIKSLNQLDFLPANQSTYGLALKPK